LTSWLQLYFDSNISSLTESRLVSVPEELRARYRRQRYRLVGTHSAVKTCTWVGKALRTAGKEHCYKQRFYGVPTHRCLQITPSLGHCTQSCVFCWRATPEALGVGWEQTQPILGGDDPEAIVEESITAHRKLIYGWGGNPDVPDRYMKEALDPVHAAISLEGEPTLYDRLGDLVSCFKKRGFRSVFVVTNGTNPDALGNLGTEPSQLYVSLCAPDKETYDLTCRPMVPDAWGRVMGTLDLLKSFKCPTVIRQTLVPKLNMGNIEDYAKLVNRAEPTYIEPKGAMSVGFARRRFAYEDMASYEDIRKFASKLSTETGYGLIDEQYESNIVLLSRLEKPIKLYA
jgi:tRNA wybutosine-synthesizing protein 1